MFNSSEMGEAFSRRPYAKRRSGRFNSKERRSAAAAKTCDSVHFKGCKIG
jgi:hypothetical protein